MNKKIKIIFPLLIISPWIGKSSYLIRISDIGITISTALFIVCVVSLIKIIYFEKPQKHYGNGINSRQNDGYQKNH